MKKPERVLVVDNDAIALEFIGQLVEQAGHEFASVRYFRKFPKIHSTFGPTMIFADVQMPGFDGIEIARWLAEAGSTAPLIMMSDGNAIAEISAGLLSEIDAIYPTTVLRKPLNVLETTVILNYPLALNA
ncbi:MAG: response regulator [Alphaproteobacteria bacterium]|nr:response regulator [Alphaproteobacteria bacterium]